MWQCSRSRKLRAFFGVIAISAAFLQLPHVINCDHFSNVPVFKDEFGFRHYNVGVLLVSGTGTSFDAEKISPAVDMALDIVNNLYLKPHGIVLDKVQRSYPACDNSLTPGLAADMRFLSNVIAFIGPACGFALDPVATLAAYWNVPIVTGLGDQPPSAESEITGDKLLGGLKRIRINDTGVFGDKSKYSTLTRLSYCQCSLKQVFDTICRAFKWKHLAIVYDRSDLFSFTVGRVLLNGMKQAAYEVYGRDIDGVEDMDEALTEISAHARIVILSLQEHLVREFMLKAHEKGLTNGDWAFLDVELFKNKPSDTNYWQQGDKNDFYAKEAYEALLTISLLMPKSHGWNNFATDVIQRAALDYNFTFPEDEHVNFFTGAFYDGVILLGMALNETLWDNGSVMDGRSITLRMWNRTFQGITGKVTIDENGDRDADYSILDMNTETGHFEIVAHYESQEMGMTRIRNKTILWPQARSGPPPDVPECGFLEMGCVDTLDGNDILPYISAVVVVLIILIIIVIVYVYKYMKNVEAENTTRWRIKPEDLLSDIPDTKSNKIGAGDDKESSKGSLSLGTGTGAQNTFAPTAIHKGIQVALRKLSLIKRVEFTKHILADIRQVRDVQHENICRLIGLCLSSSDPKSTSEKWDSIVVCTEYCSRGSLRDVLLNAHIHLDWPFRLSLISDVVNGISYLHSNFGAHGRLTSSKCLVDARFVVKIADFGLNTLRTLQKPEARETEYFYKLFWTAPEHSPIKSNQVMDFGSLKGDIYSFAFILYEVSTRSLPFSSHFNTYTPEEIVTKIATSVSPFRPELSDDMAPQDIRQLICHCWAENPDERPADFNTIKQTLRRMMKGTGTVSLVDDLLRRLEQHAFHLESLVEEKTRELEQEKRRSEDLLYQVLPRQVAQQLLRGETVVPDFFDSVSLYFSDIVGFTEICAKSSPIEVVDFLNNLYSTFDGILDSFDAYKVETIGDAYMVVSGAPQRNEERHVTEIAYLSLAVLNAVTNFEIAHMKSEQLKIRIGIHTGPVCAGVVGHRMPHYCLFGDTVNTASRMESSGLPLKIHVSQATVSALNLVGGFQLIERGEVVLKGKGVTKTFWLEGCDDESKWKRLRHSSAGSIETRGSMNTNLIPHAPSPSIGIGMLKLSTSQSQTSTAPIHIFSPSNNVFPATTTIRVSPAN